MYRYGREGAEDGWIGRDWGDKRKKLHLAGRVRVAISAAASCSGQANFRTAYVEDKQLF